MLNMHFYAFLSSLVDSVFKIAIALSISEYIV